ncbi:hypothetical protein [Hymenobacter mucosus]|uniref:Uncharacterized protein n=1 Tax=Hymenobacter mucosus TaxID=1411120 RepID=A0A239AAS2_9BACT|nr:hypothetical protein [Hymenobacter mucosus]SNR92737.1 hypothetical protein SAMN06269173_111118 [Hymenobacter mucosus]
MSIKRPDLYEHQNDDLAIVDSDGVRGGRRVVASRAELYALVEKADQLKQDVSIVRILSDSENSNTPTEVLLVDDANIGTAAGWQLYATGGTDGTPTDPGADFVLYTGTGQNTDGAMTQKATTDALNGKANSEHTHPAEQVTGLGRVAYTNDYNDLANKPTIPTGEDAPLVVTITYAALVALAENRAIVPGQTYRITNRPAHTDDHAGAIVWASFDEPYPGYAHLARVEGVEEVFFYYVPSDTLTERTDVRNGWRDLPRTANDSTTIEAFFDARYTVGVPFPDFAPGVFKKGTGTYNPVDTFSYRAKQDLNATAAPGSYNNWSQFWTRLGYDDSVLAPVAKSNSYNDLANKPTIPAPYNDSELRNLATGARQDANTAISLAYASFRGWGFRQALPIYSHDLESLLEDPRMRFGTIEQLVSHYDVSRDVLTTQVEGFNGNDNVLYLNGHTLQLPAVVRDVRLAGDGGSVLPHPTGAFRVPGTRLFNSIINDTTFKPEGGQFHLYGTSLVPINRPTQPWYAGTNGGTIILDAGCAEPKHPEPAAGTSNVQVARPPRPVNYWFAYQAGQATYPLLAGTLSVHAVVADKNESLFEDDGHFTLNLAGSLPTMTLSAGVLAELNPGDKVHTMLWTTGARPATVVTPPVDPPATGNSYVEDDYVDDDYVD